MMFTKEQTAALSAILDESVVKQRQGLSYIEGWWAIKEANRIFGFDNWNRETVFLECVRPAELVAGSGGKKSWRTAYIAKVKVTVLDRETGQHIIREGTGFGQGIHPDAGEVHEKAVKEAETDAMKRALMTFGNPFGLALYDKTQEEVGAVEPSWVELFIDMVSQAETVEQLEEVWKASSKDAKELGSLRFNELKKMVTDKLTEMKKEK